MVFLYSYYSLIIKNTLEIIIENSLGPKSVRWVFFGQNWPFLSILSRFEGFQGDLEKPEKIQTMRLLYSYNSLIIKNTLEILTGNSLGQMSVRWSIFGQNWSVIFEHFEPIWRLLERLRKSEENPNYGAFVQL